MQLRFNIDNLTLDDMIAVTEGRKLSDIKQCMVKSLVDEDGKRVQNAEEVVGAIQYRDFADAAKRFADALSEAKESAVPPTGGGR